MGVLKLNVNRLQEGLQTKRVGRGIVFSHEVTSTNDLAKKLAALGAEDGTVIVAEIQTCGRGRLNRKWISPNGGLWFSIILRPSAKPSDASKLVFVAGLAVAKTLRELYDLDISTKWPNDVLTNGRKICGILAEMNSSRKETNYVVLGVGVNANFRAKILPEKLWENATSLRTELGRDVNLEQLFRTLLEKLESTHDILFHQGFTRVLADWKTFARFLGGQIQLTDANEKWVGLALDVDVDGSLILALGDGTKKRFLTGDVSLRIK